MEYFLGIDIGTTSAKAIAFSAAGETLASRSVSYEISHPVPEWSEQDPDEIAQAVFTTVDNILQDLHPHIPQLCAFSSAMHSMIVLDKDNIPITPSIIWADNRASDYAKHLHDIGQARAFYERTGLPVHAMSPFCKMLWLKDRQPEIFHRAFKMVGIKEWIFFKLFGIFQIDVSVAAATGFMNIDNQQWDPWIMEQCGVRKDQFSEIVPVDHILQSQQIFPSLQSTPFIIGGSDGAMANLGSTDENNSLVITIGTSSAARIIADHKHLDVKMRTFCYYLKPSQWLVGGASNNGGIVLQWLQENIIQSGKPVSEFLEAASSVAPGSEGVLFLPYLLGERAPLWNAEAKAVFFGLTINHGQSELIRAAMEAVIFCLLSISQPIMENSKIEKISASGGFARSELWLQMLADIFGLQVVLSETIENSAWGAAKCGMIALGIPASEMQSSKIFNPDHAVQTVYQNSYRKFLKLYDLLKDEFDQ